jgi:hypothetical protein
MKDKGILKFKSKYSKGPMHYIQYNGNTYSITNGTSRKVKSLREEGTLEIASHLLSRKWETKKIEIIEDPKVVREVFNFMIANKHSYHKSINNDFVALRYL